jgi:PIN domain nuclease of toxin-antitoxin system
MRSLLLDSQIFLWVITGKSDLSRAAARLIATTPDVYVSVLTFYELKVKEASGKLRLPDNLAHQAASHNIKVLDLTSKHLAGYEVYHARNPDPFDNALLTVAEAQHLNFLTADALIIALQKSYDWIINGS